MIEHETLRAAADAVDGERVLRRLDELAAIGAIPGGGITRLAFSPEEEAALELVTHWLVEAGLAPAYDEFGNLFASSDGNLAGATTSVSGSHLDTVPNGGPYDGALGVVAAIEAVEAMRTTNAMPVRPLEVVVWRCEEPVRFSQGRVGSLLFTGQVRLDDLIPLGDPPLDVRSVLAAEGRHPRRESSRTIASCLELHIEQGRRLERANRSIGVVTSVAAPIRLEIAVKGRADHSGAAPMDDRCDALCAAADVILAVEDAGRSEAKADSAATSARVVARPGTINVVPGEASVLVDIRGVDLASMERIVERVGVSCAEIAKRRGTSVDSTVLSRGSPTILDGAVVDALASAVRSVGTEPLLLPSGAGHDAQCLAETADVGILFVPSVNGASHCPEEFTHPDDLVKGVCTLAACWRMLADR